MRTPAPLDTVFLVEKTQSRRLGSRWVFEKEIASTNDLAKELISKGTPEGTVVVADCQTRGKGRQGRAWASINQGGVYLSTLLYPPNPVDTSPWLTLIAAIAAADALAPWCAPDLKWPNDLLVNDRKIGGILCEYIPDCRPSPAVIVGIGLNLHQQPEDFPDEIKALATSVAHEADSEPSRTEIIHKLIEALDREYEEFLQTGPQQVVLRWSGRSRMFGKQVSLRQGNTTFTGTAKRLDRRGHLVIETPEGEMTFSAGEVTLSKNTI